jgi:catechol 2,3-dioxygenase-like lactoylglutathione lyase family enzyme
MFSELTPVATLPTKDLARARKFYEGTLGLTIDGDESPAGINYKAGSGKVFVYQSEFAGTNEATSVYFPVSKEDFDAEVSALRERGVSFLTYDLEGMNWEGDVAVMGDFKTVWFTDPDGNIINLGSM